MLVYLAGPITGMTYDAATQWREDVALNLPTGMRGISPMRGKEYLKTLVPDNLPSVLKDGTLPMSGARAIFSRDTFDIRRSDVVLANLRGADRVSVGTVFELGYAHALGKTVIVVMEAAGNPHDHPFVREAATFVVGTTDEALALMRSLV